MGAAAAASAAVAAAAAVAVAAAPAAAAAVSSVVPPRPPRGGLRSRGALLVGARSPGAVVGILVPAIVCCSRRGRRPQGRRRPRWPHPRRGSGAVRRRGAAVAGRGACCGGRRATASATAAAAAVHSHAFRQSSWARAEGGSARTPTARAAAGSRGGGAGGGCSRCSRPLPHRPAQGRGGRSYLRWRVAALPFSSPSPLPRQKDSGRGAVAARQLHDEL